VKLKMWASGRPTARPAGGDAASGARTSASGHVGSTMQRMTPLVACRRPQHGPITDLNLPRGLRGRVRVLTTQTGCSPSGEFLL
jgi:hypothetical protein